MVTLASVSFLSWGSVTSSLSRTTRPGSVRRRAKSSEGKEFNLHLGELIEECDDGDTDDDDGCSSTCTVEAFYDCTDEVGQLSVTPHATLLKLPRACKDEVIHYAAMYEHRMQSGSKPIFHLEAFIARLMSIYKKQQMNQFGS